MTRQIRVKVRGKWHTVEVEESQGNPFKVKVDGEVIEVEVGQQPGPPTPPPTKPTVAESSGPVGVMAITQEDKKIIRSPMPGRIVAISVKVWDQVTPGTEVCILETMKLEQGIHVSQRGTIRAIFIVPGQSVASGDPLIQLA